MSRKSITAWEYHIDTSFIEDLSPINRLSQRGRARLLTKAKIQDYKHNDCINSEREEHWFMYLLKGDYIIGSRNTSLTRKPEHYNDGVQRPVFSHNRQNEITFSVSSKVIRFDKKLYEILLHEEQTEESKFIEMTNPEKDVFFNILSASKYGKPEIVGLVSSVKNIQTQLKAYHHDITSLTALVGSDPVFAGNVLSEANSERFIGMPSITSLEQALERLDLSELENILIRYSDSALFEDDGSPITNLIHEIYSHSIRIATWCRELAKKSKCIDQKQAFAAGLLHEIGELLALKHARDSANFSSNKAELLKLVEKIQPLISPMILSKWGLGHEFIDVAEVGHNFDRFSASDGDYGDVVITAHWCDQACNGEKNGLPAMHDVPAFRKLGLEYMNSKQLRKMLLEVDSQCQKINGCSRLSKAS